MTVKPISKLTSTEFEQIVPKVISVLSPTNNNILYERNEIRKLNKKLKKELRKKQKRKTNTRKMKSYKKNIQFNYFEQQ